MLQYLFLNKITFWKLWFTRVPFLQWPSHRALNSSAGGPSIPSTSARYKEVMKDARCNLKYLCPVLSQNFTPAN